MNEEIKEAQLELNYKVEKFLKKNDFEVIDKTLQNEILSVSILKDGEKFDFTFNLTPEEIITKIKDHYNL